MYFQYRKDVWRQKTKQVKHYSNFFDKPFLCLTGNSPGVGLVQFLQQAITCAKIHQKNTPAYGAYVPQWPKYTTLKRVL